MRPSGSASSAVVLLWVAALLSFLARAFIDYRFVYAEVNMGTGSLRLVTVLQLAFYGAWIWAIVAASHQSRRAMFVLLAYDVLLVVFGLVTMISLCPSPCRTAWPMGQIAVWSNLIVGALATASVATTLFRKPGPAL
jgi:hypothetical protein